MAVYEHVYAPYTGERTPSWSRFLVIPRYAIRELFASKLLTGYFIVCFVYPLVAAIIVYLHHNANALAIFQLPVDQILPIDKDFFRYFVAIQARFAFLLALFVGPALLASDLANNGLPLYLSRPFSRTEYVVGKLSVILGMLSAVTWIPGLMLWALQAYLEGAGWAFQNAWLAGAIVVSSVAWLLTLSLLALAISAFVKWGLMARAAMFGLLVVPAALAGVVDAAFNTSWGDVLSPQAMASALWNGLFQADRVGRHEPVPAWVGAMLLTFLCVACVGLLARKVRAYEVVR